MMESWKTIAKPQGYFHKRLLDLLTVPVLRLLFSLNIGFTWHWILVQLLAGLQADQGLDSPPQPAPHQPPNGESPSPMGIPPKLPKFPQVHVH